jgi:threonine/homoserine/homoserine lactone efflux protein
MESVLPSVANFSLFVGAALVLLLIPGPAVLYIIGRSVEQGRLAGLVSDMGIHTATLVHVLAAALGLSALLMSSALAFSIVKYAGAAYLIYLGLKKLFGRNDGATFVDGQPHHGYARLFRDGFVVNLLNPKTALFFLAFLPQFVDVTRGHVVLQIVFLGLTFTVLGLFTDGCYAMLAGTAGGWLKRSRGYQKIERYVSGGLFIGLGLTTAFAGTQKK